MDVARTRNRAALRIAGDREGASFQRAGTWYVAGSNRCVYSNPLGELSASVPVRETSNRRFRRERVSGPPGARPLLPGDAATEEAFSEFRYAVYSYVIPDAP